MLVVGNGLSQARSGPREIFEPVAYLKCRVGESAAIEVRVSSPGANSIWLKI